MKYTFILLLALCCYAQLVSPWCRGGGRGRTLRKLAKKIDKLEEDISCLKDDIEKCKSELKGLNDRLSKLLTMLFIKDPKMVCTFFPGKTFPAGDGCNVCSCGPKGGLPICSKRPVPCDTTAGCYDKNGKFFKVGAKQFDGCNWCKCSKDFKWSCTEKYCSPKGCCYNGCVYKVGQSFLSADGCNTCSCKPNGSVPCTKKGCKIVCPSRSQVLPGILTKCSKKKPCPEGKMCCPYDCKNYCVEGVDKNTCPSGLPMVGPNGEKLSCGWGPGSNKCPPGSNCISDPLSRSGVCCPTVGPVCPKDPPAKARKCPKKKYCPRGKMCCTYDCKSLCVKEPKCPRGEPLVDSNGNELFCGRGPTRVDCPKGTHCKIDPVDRYAVCCDGPQV